MKERATLRVVAARAGVAVATASYVLNRQDRQMRISEGTRDRVLRAARELDYRPNMLARALRSKVTQTLALVSDSIASEDYAGEMIRGSLAAALDRSHLLLVLESGEDPAVEERLLETLLDSGVDGFVYARASTSAVVIPALLRGREVVLLNCFDAAGTGPTAVPAVVPDEYQAGRDAARSLIQRGHGKIHLVGTPEAGVYAAVQRLRGIQDEMAGAQRELAGIIHCKWWPESAQEAVAGLLRECRPEALICMNDRIALGAYQALGEAGLAIPEDVAVVSFDDSPLASWLRPPLSSIALPYFEMGRRAVDLLLDRSRSGTESLPMPVHLRRSVG